MQENKIKLQKILAEKVKNHRKSAGKSMTLLANEIGLSKSILSDLEKGFKDPQLSTLWRIAEGLGLSLSEMIAEIEKDENIPRSFIDNPSH